MDWGMEVFVGLFSLALVLSLVTGKTLNPIRLGSPMIVNRRDHPVRYWSSVLLLSLIVAPSIWMIIGVATGANPQ